MSEHKKDEEQQAALDTRLFFRENSIPDGTFKPNLERDLFSDHARHLLKDFQVLLRAHYYAVMGIISDEAQSQALIGRPLSDEDKNYIRHIRKLLSIVDDIFINKQVTRSDVTSLNVGEVVDFIHFIRVLKSQKTTIPYYEINIFIQNGFNLFMKYYENLEKIVDSLEDNGFKNCDEKTATITVFPKGYALFIISAIGKFQLLQIASEYSTPEK